MEVVVLSHNHNFIGDKSLPFDQPKHLEDYYFSAPTSPSHFSDGFLAAENWNAAATVPFAWEERPGIAKSIVDYDDDFAFDVMSQDDQWETASQLSSAEELFDGGMIRPLKPPEKKKKGRDYRVSEAKRKLNYNKDEVTETRGRGGGGGGGSNVSSRRATRSLSPIRDGEYFWEDQKQHANTVSSGYYSKSNTKKWSFKDFFLFRSASEGRAADKDNLKKYTAAYKHSSFRAIEFPSTAGPISHYRRGPVSAHELHYTANLAVSQELKRKTFLPYKQGILGRMAFNPTVHALANGFGFSNK